MAEGSPFKNILDLMKREGSNKDVSVSVNEVISASPLRVRLQGITLEDDDFFITETVKEASLSSGDLVLVLIDGNNIYLIDKVVT